jgi:hypothetical protein
MIHYRYSRATLVAMTAIAAIACVTSRAFAQDSSFAAMQQRGKMAMGVDQYASVHHFDDLADGGRIQLQSDTKDSGATHAIRAHLHGISKAFASGDFSTPEFVHMKKVPGTGVMAAKRSVITYTFHELPGGGELRMTTSDSAARNAIHEFLAFQRNEHHAGGHDMHGDSGQHP